MTHTLRFVCLGMLFAVGAQGFVTAATVEEHIAALKDQDPGVRGKAVEALGRLRDARAVGPLIQCLKDPDSKVRRSAAEALAGVYSPASDAEKATYFVAEKGWDWAVALGKPALEPLIACLRDENLDVRCEAIEALGKLGDAQAIDPLISCLKHKDSGVREFAAKALGKLGYKPASETEKATYLVAAGSWDELVKLGKPAVDPLIACLKDEFSYVRQCALESLGQIGDPRAVEPLVACLKDEDRCVRISTPWALAGLSDERAVKPLIACLRDEDRFLRQTAAGALGCLGDAQAFVPLIACLKDESADVRAEAASWLGDFKDARAVEPLIVCLKDKGSEVRRGAAMGLEKLKDARATEPLIACLEDADRLVRGPTVMALGELRDARAVDPLIACLKDKDGGVRFQAARALEKLEDKRALPALCGALPDWTARTALSAALEKFGWKPQSETQEVYLWICRGDAKSLNANWDKVKPILLADLKSGEPLKVENAAYAFVCLGKEDVVEELIRILDSHGTEAMAQAYLDCGQKRLVEAGRAWAARHHSKITSRRWPDEVPWGSW